MKIAKHIFFIVFISICCIACKNDAKESSSKSENGSVDVENAPTNQLNDSLKKKQLNSVVSKMMFTDESKSFVRYLISADMIDKLSFEDGPFTVFVPINEAFDALTEEQLSPLQEYSEKEFLISVLNSHIISGNMDSVMLVQEIKKNNGELTLKALSGAELKFSRKGSEIVVTDENGTKAKIGKSDIKGSNGVVHLLDAVLIMN
jgi:uncharacterized surface protein with fasciclin (FAS1) repeats